jgi:hypothetical protein
MFGESGLNQRRLKKDRNAPNNAAEEKSYFKKTKGRSLVKTFW